MTLEQTARNRRLVVLGLVIITIVSIVWLLLGIKTYSASGTLAVTTPDKDSLVTISQADHAAANIGTGSATVRLPAGRYLVGVARRGQVSTKAVTVVKGQAAHLSLSATSVPLLPTSADIDLVGTNVLVSHGVSQQQISALRSAIFAFKRSTKVARINTSTISSPPFDPNSVYRTFGLTFTLNIDGTNYAAKLSWIQTDTAYLSLADQSGAVIYDSSNPSDGD